MVQLVEVEDEHFQQPQPGLDDEGDYTDTGMLSLSLQLDRIPYP